MSAKPHQSGPAREVIAPPHVSLRKEVGRESGPTPLEYGEVRLWLVAQGSNALFCYWEFRPEEHPEAVGASGRAHFFLRVLQEGTGIENTTEIEPSAGNWTIQVAELEAAYFAELGFFNSKGVWCFLARSAVARIVPPEPGEHPSTTPAAPPSEKPANTTRWTPTQERHLNRILKEEVARHRPQRTGRSREKNRGRKK